MTNINVEFTINSKIIEAEYIIMENKQFHRNGRSLDFTIEEYAEYLNIILNSNIKKSGGQATTPFYVSETPISNSLSIAFQSIGQVIDSNRDFVFTPVSVNKSFTISEEKFNVIRSSLQTVTKELAIVNRIPGPRSTELKEVMTSNVKSDILYAINDFISPNAIVNCSLVQPKADKLVAFSIQQNVNIEVIAYTDKLARI